MLQISYKTKSKESIQRATQKEIENVKCAVLIVIGGTRPLNEVGIERQE